MIKNTFYFLVICLMTLGCSDSDKEEFSELLETGEIISYQNIQLGGVELQDSIGSYFSTSSGNVIRSKELNALNGSTIDIAYVGTLGSRFFESPDSVTFWKLTEIPNATTTAFINSMAESTIDFSTETFDNMTDDFPLRDLNITTDFRGLPLSGTPIIVLFENANGKKGVIKITEMSPSQKSGTVTFDLKIQK